MSLNKAIYHGKEKRKPHIGAKSKCYACKNHGSCGYCRMNRLHSDRKRKLTTHEEIREEVLTSDS